MLNDFLDIFGLFRKFKIYVMIEWCIDVLNEVCNDVKVRSRHSIFRKENTVLRLLGCAFTRYSSRRRYPDSTEIMESYR